VLHRGSGLGVSYLGFDLRGAETPAVTHPDGSHRNPFLDRRVREAVALAIDHAAVNRTVYDGGAVVATQFVPGLVFGFDRDLPAPARDLARARQLLADSGFGAGFDLRLDVRRIMERYGEPLHAALRALGLRPRLEVLDDEPFFEAVRGGRSSLYLLRFSCRSGDAQELLDKWVHSRDEARGLGRSNHSYERNPLPGLDEEIAAARVELRPVERARLLAAILRRVQAEHVVVPLLQDLDFTFASPDVEWHPRADTYRIVRDARFKN
jgi:peptide/nickel transport system substrate-binding protein